MRVNSRFTTVLAIMAARSMRTQHVGTKIVIFALVLTMSTCPIYADFPDKSGSLPGTTTGTKVAIVGGIAAGAALVWYLVVRHARKAGQQEIGRSGLVESPKKVHFASSTEKTITLSTKADVNLSELQVTGTGFALVNSPSLPVLIQQGTPLELRLSRAASSASRGTLNVTCLDSKGKQHSWQIALLAYGK